MLYVTVRSNFGKEKQIKYVDVTDIRVHVCKKLAKEKVRPRVDQRQLMSMLNYLHEPYKVSRIIKE